MQHTEEQIGQIVRSLLHDIERDYHQNEEWVIHYSLQETIPHIDETISRCWIVGISVNDDQFGHKDGSVIVIFIDDDNGSVKGYLDSSCGRPVPQRAKKGTDGKYHLEIVSTG